MFDRIGALIAKEFIQFLRDRLLTTFIIALPVVQLILLAQATGRGVSDQRATVLDLDRSSASRRLVTMLDNSETANVHYHSRNLAEIRRLLDRGQAALAVVIPPGFAADLSAPTHPIEVQVIADGSNAVSASVALGVARMIVTEYVSEVAVEHGLACRQPLDLRVTVHYNSTLNVRFFTIPAQVGFIVYQITLAVSSLGLARERELGTLEQLIVAPLTRLELIAGKAVPALTTGVFNFLLMLIIAVRVFDVPMRGSLFLLFALTLLFIGAEIGYGILISTIARTQQQAILFVFVLAMFDISFSGYLVRVKNLPVVLQAIAQVVPFRHYLTIIRGIMLKGAGLDALWPHAAAMLLMGLLVTAVAVCNLSRSLD